MTLAFAHGGWDITFPASPDNLAVVLITECKGPVPFYAYDRVDITEDFQEDLHMRRQPTPAGEPCTFEALLIQADDDNPDHERITDSASLSD